MIPVSYTHLDVYKRQGYKYKYSVMTVSFSLSGGFIQVRFKCCQAIYTVRRKWCISER